MPTASLGEAEISFLDEGEGDAIVLIHGFASTKEVNWLNTGWVRALREAGYRVVAFDNRGHGASSKFHRPQDYAIAKMAADAVGLLDHLRIERAHVMGYSMGAHIAGELAIHHAPRLARLILAGNGSAMTEERAHWGPVRDALLAPSLDAVSDPMGRAFRAFAEQTGGDLAALAACMSARAPASAAQLAKVGNPVLVAVGTDDDVAGSGERLAALIPNARYLPIPGRDHMRAVGDKVYKAGVLEFLAG